MFILAAETSTQLGSVAIFENSTLLSYRESNTQKSHSELLNAMIAESMHESGIHLNQIDLFAVGLGPGSFTGIRIAGNVGKTFASVYQKPLVAVDSLELLAFAAINKGTDTLAPFPIVSMINAYKNMVYFAKYNFADFNKEGGHPLITSIIPPCVVRIQDLESVITEPCWIIGDGYKAYQKFLPLSILNKVNRNDSWNDFPNAQTLGQVALLRARNHQTIEWNSYIPLYLRASEAEENFKGIIFKPLVP